MPSMVDPHIGLLSYQQALLQGAVHPEPGRVHPELTLFVDDVPTGKRLTYALHDGMTVKATAVYVMNGRSEGKPYFQVGYAVAENFRNQGIAQKILRLSIEEMSAGFKKVIPAFYVEAVVSKKNLASLRVAQKVIGGEPEEITDKESGEKAQRYTVLVGE
jgi:hypothetical protein